MIYVLSPTPRELRSTPPQKTHPTIAGNDEHSPQPTVTAHQYNRNKRMSCALYPLLGLGFRMEGGVGVALGGIIDQL